MFGQFLVQHRVQLRPGRPSCPSCSWATPATTGPLRSRISTALGTRLDGPHGAAASPPAACAACTALRRRGGRLALRHRGHVGHRPARNAQEPATTTRSPSDASPARAPSVRLIPPSTTFILYGVLAEQSIGDLFMAGVHSRSAVHGLLHGRRRGSWCSQQSRSGRARSRQGSSGSKRVSSLQRRPAHRGCMFILVIGGIYGGMFTATEGGGVGACGHAGPRPTPCAAWPPSGSHFRKSTEESSRFTAMCFALLAGANHARQLHDPEPHPHGARQRHRRPRHRSHARHGAPSSWCICFLGCFIPAIPLVLIMRAHLRAHRQECSAGTSCGSASSPRWSTTWPASPRPSASTCSS